ncbi:MAG: hypothetical protein DRN04_06370 [Thermoprotei archaeon]|nr:MAG: hypothetical protein DRN04_06370 [Thermoprotei archaeon]
MHQAALVRKIRKEKRSGMYVKVSKDLAKHLKLKTGEVVVLRGKKKTACWIRGTFDGENEIIVSQDTWRSLGFDGYVSSAVILEKTNSCLAEEISLRLVLPEGKKLKLRELKMLKGLLTGTPLCTKGTAAVYLHSEKVWVNIEVESIKPGPAGILHKKTLLKFV